MRLFIFFAILLLYNYTSAQTIIILDDYIVKFKSHYTFNINGTLIKTSDLQRVLFSNYPKTDTIVFQDSRKEIIDTVFTRMRPNKSYIIKIGCCDSGFDIFEKSYLEKNVHLERIVEYGKVRLKVVNNKNGDTLNLIYGDIFSDPVPINNKEIVIGNKKSDWIMPFKSYYTNSNNYVVVSNYDNRLFLNLDNEYFGINKEKIRLKFLVRVFTDDKLCILYNYSLNTVVLDWK